MSQQLSLDSLPYIPDSDTSEAAAESMKPDAATLRERVFAFIREHGGATDEEAQRGLKMNPSTQRPRRVELVERGLVRDGGKKRRTSSGRWAVVWEICQ
jgi:hypothetical protein